MPQKEALRIFAAAGPEQPLSSRLQPARMFYHFAQPFPAPAPAPGGIMVVAGDVRASRSHEIAAECRRCGYGGVLFGYGAVPILELLRLCQALERRGLRIYLAENAWYRDCQTTVLISSALSGGSFRQRLADARERYGSVALDLERLSRRFPLPCPDGQGRILQPGELDALQKLGSAPFFSEDLQCMAFYAKEKDSSCFVLYDTEETLQRKALLAESMGIRSFFLLCPEWPEEVILRLQQMLKERENPVI